MEPESSKRGLWKLMLRLPALRGQLQMLSARNPSLLGLCGAYEDASSTLDRMRKDPVLHGAILIREYEQLCSEIETEIIEICLAKNDDR